MQEYISLTTHAHMHTHTCSRAHTLLQLIHEYANTGLFIFLMFGFGSLYTLDIRYLSEVFSCPGDRVSTQSPSSWRPRSILSDPACRVFILFSQQLQSYSENPYLCLNLEVFFLLFPLAVSEF